MTARPTTTARRRRVELLLERDGRRRWCCGAELADSDITLDHVIPLADGGSNRLRNLRLACASCNGQRNTLHQLQTNVAAKTPRR